MDLELPPIQNDEHKPMKKTPIPATLILIIACMRSDIVFRFTNVEGILG